MSANWGIFQHETNSYDLRHLDERLVVVPVAGVDHGILVQFSDHCFTVEAIPDDERPIFPRSTRKDGRFCEIRHAASFGIWDHLNKALHGKVWLGEDNRYLVAAITVGEGDQASHYLIPFTLERHSGRSDARLLMRVRSAFPRTPDRHVATYGEVRFANLISLTMKGKFPKRIYDQKRKKPW